MNLDALFALSCGMYILCSGWEGKFNGLIVNALVQVTAFPPQLVVSVNKESLTSTYVQKSGYFSVSVLEKTPLCLSLAFSASAVVEILTNYLKLNTAGVRPECPLLLNIQWPT
ncbi:MAG TPA: flavin reductase [Candidatus Atribacteria bacterium]|nr:flavin reductase [Candidatus Atribacteria bacterium]